jgi:hypothetical protein
VAWELSVFCSYISLALQLITMNQFVWNEKCYALR